MRRILIFLVFISLMVLSLSAVSVNAQGNLPANVATHIIVFNRSVNVPQFAQANGLQITYEYNYVLNGIAAIVPAGRLQALARHPHVAYVEENTEVSIAVQTTPTGIDRIFASNNPNLDIDSTDDFRVDVDVAVVDTGVDFEHPDLNVVGGTDCTLSSGGGPPWARSYYCGGPGEGTGGDDDHYHGTHVGGTIGALDNGIGVVGVAPGARLWAVKVLDSSGSGYTSGIIAGIDWVVGHGNIEVLNMSLGGSGVNTAYEDAIDNAVANGVVVVVAAGNSSADANNYSPAFVPSAITVSALSDGDGAPGGNGTITCRSDEDDTFANFSNYGSAVDIIAPGVCILSTYPLEQGEYGTISGTSMASPHVAGAAALLASVNTPQNAADVQAIRDQLVNSGNFDWDNSDDPDNIKEALLDVTGFDAALVPGGGSGGNQSPTASFTANCTDLSCTFDASGSSDSDGNITDFDWNFGDGATASGVTSSHTYGSDGSYTVSLTVTDNEGATDTTNQSVNVSSGGGSATVLFVGDLDGSANSSGPNWSATVTIYVQDDTGAAVSGATVSGNFSTGDSVNCTTSSSGTCSVTSSSIRKGGNPSIDFTVSNVSGSLPYSSGSNTDPDGDSDGTTITVFR